MQDDRIVVGDGGTDGDVPPGRPAWWIIALGLVVVTGIILSSGSGPDGPGTESTQQTTTTEINASAVEVPPTLPPAEIVEDTLRWQGTAGLENATHLGGIVEFDGAYWLVGRTDEGLVVWRSEDPTEPWTETAIIDRGSPGWLVEDVEVVNGRIIVAASSWRWSGGGGVVFESTNGLQWTRHRLDTGKPDRPVAVAEEIIPAGDRVILTGHGHSRGIGEADVTRLAPEIRELVERGQASLVQGSGEIHLVVAPGISVGHFPVEERAGNEADGSAEPLSIEPFMWSGENTADLRPESRANQPLALKAMRAGDGRLVGQTGIRLAFSEDGLSWEPTGPFFGRIAGFVPWNGGFVLVPEFPEPLYWTEGAREAIPLLPEELREDQLRARTAPSAGEWGLAVTRRGQQWTNPGTLLVAATEEGDLHLINGILVELVRDGETVWREEVSGVNVELEEDRRLRFGSGTESISVPIEAWLEGLFVATGGVQPADTAEVLHTVDGREWSSTSWAEISGSETVAQLSLLGTNDFVLVVDYMMFPTLRVNFVATGLPYD